MELIWKSIDTELVWLWSRARLAINQKQKYFSFLDHKPAEYLVFVFGL